MDRNRANLYYIYINISTIDHPKKCVNKKWHITNSVDSLANFTQEMLFGVHVFGNFLNLTAGHGEKDK